MLAVNTNITNKPATTPSFVAGQIKPITLEEAKKDFQELKQFSLAGRTVTDRCRVGNNVVDFFTFEQRLHTKGKYNVSYYEFIERIPQFSQKKFIQNMLHYYSTVKNKNKTKNQWIVWKEVYNICISAINIFRPLVAVDIYRKYKPTSVLDICAGWGGRLVGAVALGVHRYTGIEINHALKEPYQKMMEFLKEEGGATQMDMLFEDALHVDYGVLPNYDMVLTSPPYYFLEKYQHNVEYKNKDDMDKQFYEPLFKMVYHGLSKNVFSGRGYMILNVNKEVYDRVCVKVLGEASEQIPLKKSKRQNEYGEFLYVWEKLY
jgi:16S rRNA G966 N2-methylase RsmD